MNGHVNYVKMSAADVGDRSIMFLIMGMGEGRGLGGGESCRRDGAGMDLTCNERRETK